MSEQNGTAPEVEQTQAVSEQPQDAKTEQPKEEAKPQGEDFDWKAARFRREREKRQRVDAENAALRTELELLRRAQQSGEPVGEQQPGQQQVDMTALRTQAVREAELGLKAREVGERGRTEFSDYTARVGEMLHDYESELSQRPDFWEAVLELPEPHKMVYHLAQTPGQIDALLDLSPAKLGVQLGNMNAKLSAPKAKPVSKAPPPPSPIQGNGNTQVGYRPDMSQDEYREWRKTQGLRDW